MTRPSTDTVILDAVDSLRSTLSTILGLAESNSHNAASEIAFTVRAGLARLDLILPAVQTPKETSEPCEYFRAKDCLAGCQLAKCKEAGACQTPGNYGHGFGGMLESVGHDA